MKLLKTLVIASLVGIAFIQAWDYFEAAPPRRPTPASRMSRFGRRIAERIVAPIAAKADRGGHSLWR